MKKVQIAFIVIIMAIMVVPALSTIPAPTLKTGENRELAAFPAAFTSEGIANVNLLSEFGTWFEDHFAFRNQVVSANAWLRAKLLATSASNQLVVGKDDWLFYTGTSADYLGSEPLKDETLQNAAHNLSLMQAFAKSQGATFTFVIAPNKNSIYGSYMPKHLLASQQPHNSARLVSWLEEYEVNYIDLQTILTDEQEKLAATPSPNLPTHLYLKQDSHWNNYGAYLASEEILAASDLQPLNPPDNWEYRDDNLGDLAGMLYPFATPLERQWYYPGINDGAGQTGTTWSIVASDLSDSDIESLTDALQASVSEQGSETILMSEILNTKGSGNQSLLAYRDSFANALIPYLATQTSEATFSRLVPYDALQINTLKPDHVLVERAERHIGYLAENPPWCPSPSVRIAADAAIDLRADYGNDSSIEVLQQGVLVKVSGFVNPELARDFGSKNAKVLVMVGGVAFEAFSVSNIGDGSDNGYCAYIPSAAFNSDGVSTNNSELNLYYVCAEGTFLAK